MTTHGRSIDERELDGLLRDLLGGEGAGDMAGAAGAPPAAPDRIAEGAMLLVATTPQRRVIRWRPAGSSGTAGPLVTARFGRLALAAAVGLLVLALVVSLGGIGRSPSPTLGPSPTPAVPALVPAGSPEDGYEVLVPGAWEEEPQVFAHTRTWAGAGGSLMVSYGTSIFDPEGGAASICGPINTEWPRCEAWEVSFQLPYDPAVDGIGPIDLSGYASDRCEGGCPTRTVATTLDGEAASLSEAIAGDERWTWVSLFHDLRPVILSFSEPVSQADGRFEAIRSSFRFIDPEPAASPTPFVDPTALVRFEDADAGYELMIPGFWAPSADPLDPQPAGVHFFGEGRGFGTRGHPAMTISVGTIEGEVWICQGETHGCELVVVTSLQALGDVLKVEGDSVAEGVPDAIGGSLTIDGQAGRWLRPGYPSSGVRDDGLGDITEGNCLGCPSVLYHAFAIVDGRPVVISIDFWTVAFGEWDPDYLRTIIDSVHLAR